MRDLTPAGAAAAADALWDRLQAAVDRIGDDDWGRPTPCPRWSVHDLVGHVSGVTGLFAGLEVPQPPEGWSPPDGVGELDAFMEAGVAARADWSTERLLAEVQAARRAHVAGLAALQDLAGEAMGPLGPTDQRGLFQVRMFDLWHHLWDLQTALGLPVDLSDTSEAAVECHTYVAERAPWLYGKRAGAPDGASVRLVLGDPLGWDRTVAVDGGRAGWREDPPAEDAVVGPPAPFSLLMTGRLTREEAAGAGLQARGEEADRLLSARMFG